MKRVWKKGTALFLSLALALTLCIGMNVTALADGETDAAADAYWSITVGEPANGEITVTIGLLQEITVTGGTLQLLFNDDYFTMPTATDAYGYTVGVLTTYPSGFDSTAAVGTNGTISFTSSDIINGDTYEASDTFLVYTLYYDDTTDIADVSFSFAVTELYDENVDDITDALGTVTSDTISITHTHVYAGDPAWTWADDYSTATAAFACTALEGCESVLTVNADITKTNDTASCETSGSITYTAAVTLNGTEYTDTRTAATAATGHSYEAVVTEPTCTEGGYTTYTCSVCGDSYVGDETQATGHNYEAVVTEPTCTEGGYTTYTCSVCGDTYMADETETTGHSYGSDGYCTVCGTYSAQAAADAVMTLIDAIGTVTQDSGEAIQTAREAYDALLAADSEAAALVTNLDTLTAAEEAYAALTEAEGDTGDGSGDENGDGDTGNGGGSTGDGDTGDDSGSTGDGDTGDENGSGSDGDTGDENGSGSDGDTGDGSGSGSDGGTTAGSSYTVPSSKIAAEKVSLTGATVAQVTQTLAKLTNDGDLKDSAYYLLQAKAKKTTKKSIKLSWKKVSGAASYVVYANACGKSKKLKKYKVTGKTSLNITKIAGKKLTSGKYYKFLVIALDADGKVIQTSKVIHAATKGGSVTNAKSLTLYKSGKKVTSLTLKKGKSAKITAKVTKQNKKKKIQNHRKTKYESSNKKIATVTANGKIKAKAKGTCYIYAYAQNGVCRKIKVTVK